MQPTVEQTIERVEQLYATITGKKPPPITHGAPIPPEVDPVRHIEEQLERLLVAVRSERRGETTMETVKVDIQKLQQLNDRIVQTIEALNQLRQSVHGVQHSPAGWSPPAVSPWGIAAGYGAWSPSPLNYNPFAAYGQPFGVPSFAQPFGPTGYGIQHTAPQVWGTPWQQTSWPQSSWPQSSWPQTWGTGWSMPISNGISHSAWDPTTQWRSTQWSTPTTFMHW